MKHRLHCNMSTPEADVSLQVEAIAWRVKKSLLLHWLTCGIYSTRQSGGTQGFWKGIKENFNSILGGPEAAPRKCEQSVSPVATV